MKSAPHFRHVHRSHQTTSPSGATSAQVRCRGADDPLRAQEPLAHVLERPLKTGATNSPRQARADDAVSAIGTGESRQPMAFLEDLRVAQEGLGSLGFWALQVYRFGHLRYRFQSRLVRYPLGALHLVLAKLAEMFCGVTMGVSAQIGRRLVIEHSGAIVVHGHAVIGDDCIIRQGVTIGNQRMDRPFDAPRIGHRVNIGAPGCRTLAPSALGCSCARCRAARRSPWCGRQCRRGPPGLPTSAGAACR